MHENTGKDEILGAKVRRLLGKGVGREGHRKEIISGDAAVNRYHLLKQIKIINFIL